MVGGVRWMWVVETGGEYVDYLVWETEGRRRED